MADPAPVRLVHPDGSAWAVVAEGLQATVTTVRGGKTTTRSRSFPDARALERFVTEGVAQMVKVGFAPVGSPLSALRARAAEAREALVGVRPEAALPRTWAWWTSAPIRRQLELMWKHGGLEETVAVLADTPAVRDALVRACVPGGWPSEPLAFATASALLVPLLRLRALEARLRQLEEEVAPNAWTARSVPLSDEVDGLDLPTLLRLGGLEVEPELLDKAGGPPEAAWARIAPRVNAVLRGPVSSPSELALRAAEDEARARPG